MTPTTSQVWGDSDPLEIVKALVSQPTYGANLGVEAPAVRVLAERFQRLGIPFKVRVQDGFAYNLVASIGGGEPSILLNGHLDVVPPGEDALWAQPPFEPVVAEGQLFGRGACDAKGALGGMVAAFERLWAMRHKLKGRVILAAVGAEENGGTGVRREIAAGLRASAAIVGEPTGCVPHIAHKGRVTVEVTTHGMPAHSSSPQLGENAISRMGTLLPYLDAIHEVVSKTEHPLLGSASSTVTGISGGTAVNVVPGSCTVRIDRRLLPGDTPQSAQAAYEEAVARAQAACPELRADVQLLQGVVAAETKSDALIGCAIRAAGEVLGHPVVAEGFTASCDMTYLVHEGGIPTLILGPGDLAYAHQYNERVPVEQLYQAAEIYFRTCLLWTKTGPTPA